MAKYTEEWIANGNTKFYTRIYSVPNPKAAVVFIHGFIEHIGRYAHPCHEQ
jgi:acylglycerol lipase